MSVEDGAVAVERLLDGGIDFDAIYCFTETQALGAKRTLQERNLIIPQDVATMYDVGHIPVIVRISADYSSRAECS